MLIKCANPSCSASLHLQDGRLFLLETDRALRSSEFKAAEYFWLCKPCSVVMTLRLTQDGRVMATGLRKAIRNGLQPRSFRSIAIPGCYSAELAFFAVAIRESHKNFSLDRFRETDRMKTLGDILVRPDPVNPRTHSKPKRILAAACSGTHCSPDDQSPPPLLLGASHWV